jgi:hypothetical protein
MADEAPVPPPFPRRKNFPMTSKLLSLFLVCLALSAVMLACGGGDNANTTNTTNTATSNKNAAAANTSAANTSAANNSTASGEKIGVPECDDFIAKYEACVSGKVPAAAQASFKSSIETWRKSWKGLAANPQTKATLTQICKTQLDQTKTALSSYNCSW